jgi:Pentapeptide repeats (9 copies)
MPMWRPVPTWWSMLAAGAGAGVAAGLMLAFRRQHLQEIATVLTGRDAAERRIIELYAKAVEQLGSDKAPVRLGGLYALERLAQDNPAHRQIIVNVICGYLRMPFPPAPATSTPEPEATRNRGKLDDETGAGTYGFGGTWQQERQVRLTAQRIIAGHLRADRPEDKRSTDSPSRRFWPGIRLDLAGAALIDFDLVNGVMADADFHGATFRGRAGFDGATFRGRAGFDGATFGGDAGFGGASFHSDAGFDGATFDGGAGFGGASFHSIAWFLDGTFHGSAGFGGASFHSGTAFAGATFDGFALFSGATFDGGAGFGEATFSGATFSDHALFDKATFNSIARFDGAAFRGGAGFGGAAFHSDAWFGETAFGADAWFGGAAFRRDAGFAGATFSGRAGFDGATFHDGADCLSFERSSVPSPGAEHAWPAGWCLGPDGKGGYTVVRANDDGNS